MYKEDMNSTASWKNRLRSNFEYWLENHADSQELSEPEDINKEIDIYSLYKEICAIRAEYRKVSKKNIDTSSYMEEVLKDLKVSIDRLLLNTNKKETNAEELLTPLVDIDTRLMRLRDRLKEKPAGRGPFSGKKWEEAWDSLFEAATLISEHMNEYLLKNGISYIRTKGKKFDPNTMSAVASVKGGSDEHNTVAEEISPGCCYNGKLVRLAKVKVKQGKDNSNG